LKIWKKPLTMKKWQLSSHPILYQYLLVTQAIPKVKLTRTFPIRSWKKPTSVGFFSSVVLDRIGNESDGLSNAEYPGYSRSGV
ncbi:hypothetical protein, partial [Nitrosomonas sp.]|uniref:hypothetical protein n=1 Tax=Nitrosomonas sp. TaxID=42353 RepID=UPI001D885B7A